MSHTILEPGNAIENNVSVLMEFTFKNDRKSINKQSDGLPWQSTG